MPLAACGVSPLDIFTKRKSDTASSWQKYPRRWRMPPQGDHGKILRGVDS